MKPTINVSIFSTIHGVSFLKYGYAVHRLVFTQGHFANQKLWIGIVKMLIMLVFVGWCMNPVFP